MNVASLQRPSPLGAYHVKQKERKIEGSSSSSPNSLLSANPCFFGDFVRPCGGPSHEPRESGGCGGGAGGGGGSDGSACFGIGVTGGSNSRGATRAPADDKENEDDPTALIANALTQLSLKEREQAYEDLHGVSAAVHETPELIAITLTEMEQCLATKIHDKPAYDMAMKIRSEYVQDPKLRLMFLRADRFDANKAAHRLVKFMDWKLKLFGEAKLCQWHIGLADLDHNARCVVESGFYQLLPSRDSRGRVVLVVAGNYHLRFYRTTQALMQMAYYIYQCAAEDEANQKSGFVCIAYCLGEEEVYETSEDRNRVAQSTNLAEAMPLRLEGTHFCTPHNGIQFALTLVAKSFGFLRRARVRVHFGSPLEVQYALMGFGLPSTTIPFTTEAELKTGNHKKWYERRNNKEQALPRGDGYHDAVFSGIELPGRNDVLLGQGKPMQSHMGNQRLQELCEFYLDEYNQVNRKSKTLVAWKIVQEIWHPTGRIGDGTGGRFLKRREDMIKSIGWWEEVTDKEVLMDKVGNGLRTVRKRSKFVG